MSTLKTLNPHHFYKLKPPISHVLGQTPQIGVEVGNYLGLIPQPPWRKGEISSYSCPSRLKIWTHNRVKSSNTPTNDTLVKASFQVIRDSRIYNVTIETRYSQLLAVLNAMCKGPDNKVVTLPFADVVVDYRVVSKTETKTIDLGRVAVNAAGDICAVYIDEVEIHK